MKRYKLLKDLPFAKAGKVLEIYHSDDKKWLHIFDENREEIYQLKIGYNVVETHNEWFKEIKDSEEYFYITTDGAVYFAIKGRDEELENDRKSIGNYFETEEEAKKYMEYLKAKAVIKQDTKGFKPNWYDTEQIKYSCSYQEDRFTGYGCVKPVVDSTKTTMSSLMYFKSKEDIEESLKKHPKEWKTYLFYEQ